MATRSVSRRKAKTSHSIAAKQRNAKLGVAPSMPPGSITYLREIEGWARAQLIAVHCIHRTVDGLENDLMIGVSVTEDHLEDVWAARSALAIAVPKLKELWVRTHEIAEQFERHAAVKS